MKMISYFDLNDAANSVEYLRLKGRGKINFCRFSMEVHQLFLYISLVSKLTFFGNAKEIITWRHRFGRCTRCWAHSRLQRLLTFTCVNNEHMCVVSKWLKNSIKINAWKRQTSTYFFLSKICQPNDTPKRLISSMWNAHADCHPCDVFTLCVLILDSN